MFAIATTRDAARPSDAEIREARSLAMGRFRTSLLLSMPLVGFLGAPMMYAGMLGYAIREGRRPFLAFLAVAAFCIVHYGAMVLGVVWGFNRFDGFGVGTVLSGCVVGFAVAFVFLTAVHPKLGWLED